MKKKISCLITGISGMVGSHLLDFLLNNTNWNIHGLIRWSSKLDNIEHHLDKINKGQRIFLEYGDLQILFLIIGDLLLFVLMLFVLINGDLFFIIFLKFIIFSSFFLVFLFLLNNL